MLIANQIVVLFDHEYIWKEIMNILLFTIELFYIELPYIELFKWR